MTYSGFLVGVGGVFVICSLGWIHPALLVLTLGILLICAGVDGWDDY